MTITEQIQKLKDEWSIPKDTQDNSTGFCLKCSFGESCLPPKQIDSLGVKIPQELQEFWLNASTAKLFEDVEYGQWGLQILSPEEAEKETQKEIDAKNNWPTDRYVLGDLIVGQFIGDGEEVIVRCDPNAADFGSIIIALEIYRRDQWDTVAKNFNEFLDKYITAEGDKFWEVMYGTNYSSKNSSITTLTEGIVDINKEHIKIKFIRPDTGFVVGAIVTQISKGNFVYQLLIENNSSNQSAIKAILHSLNFFLIEHPKEDSSRNDPWDYAIYHCSTTENIQADVYWGYYAANFEIVQNKMKVLLELTAMEEVPMRVEITEELKTLTDERYLQQIYRNLLWKREVNFKETTDKEKQDIRQKINKSAEKNLLTMNMLSKEMRVFLHLMDLRKDSKFTDFMIDADYALFKDSSERIKDTIAKKSFYYIDINYCFYALEETVKAFGTIPRTGMVDNLDSIRDIKMSLLNIMNICIFLKEEINDINRFVYNDAIVHISLLIQAIPEKLTLLDQMYSAVNEYLNGKSVITEK